MLEYLDRNHFDDVYKGPGDSFFGSLEASRPEIYPIYWSPSQMQARQSDEMAAVQSFLNRLWRFEQNGKRWFDPDVSVIYPDRIRRRPRGTTSKGLGRIPIPARWSAGCFPPISRFSPTFLMAISTPTTRGTPRTVPSGRVYRRQHHQMLGVPHLPGLDRAVGHDPGQGLLHVVPIPEAMAYVLLRPLLDDVPEDELCGVAPGRVLPISEQWHPLLIKALSSIPALNAGDSVWWHCDIIHSVAPVENQQGLGKCDVHSGRADVREKNLAYAQKVKIALEKGASPGDFRARTMKPAGRGASPWRI